MSEWQLADAVPLLVEIEAICPAFGFHVALTGGLLYKKGARKDLDILFYRIRQTILPDYVGLMKALDEKLGIKLVRFHGPWLTKAERYGMSIDMFFPEDPFKPVKIPKPRAEGIHPLVIASGNYV